MVARQAVERTGCSTSTRIEVAFLIWVRVVAGSAHSQSARCLTDIRPLVNPAFPEDNSRLGFCVSCPKTP